MVIAQDEKATSRRDLEADIEEALLKTLLVRHLYGCTAWMAFLSALETAVGVTDELWRLCFVGGSNELSLLSLAEGHGLS